MQINIFVLLILLISNISMESVSLNQCNIQSFQGHRCFENGLLICNQAKILIVRLDALNHHNDEPRYILREDLFRQIVLHQLKPCFQNLFENINITFADELGIDFSTNDLNSSTGFILGEKFTHRGQNNNKSTSVLMEHFKKFFQHTNNNNTLNLAFIFSDEASYSYIPFLRDIVENQKDFIDFIDKEMVLPKFVLFEPNKGYFIDESVYVAWTVLKQKSHQKVGFIFVPMDELDKNTMNEKINISICERIVAMQKACKNDKLTSFNSTVIIAISLLLLLLLLLIISTMFILVKKLKRNSVPNLVLLEDMNLLQIDPTPQIDQIKSIKKYNKIEIPQHGEFDFNNKDFVEVETLGSTRNVIKKIMHIPTGFTLAGKFIPYPISLYENAEVKQNVKLIERELKIFRDMSGCSHIVDFYGFCLYEFKILIFMELMDFSLKELYEKVYRNGTKFAEEFIGLVVIAVLDAMQFCKSRKIMHRDIKPENILIHKQGHIKLCDFGESRILENSLAVTFAGTIAYWPPERFDSKKFRPNYDIRSDIWSFGMTVLEIAMGQHPLETFHFKANAANSIKMTVQISKFNFGQFEDDIRANYSGDLAELLNMCFKKVEERPKIDKLREERFYKRYENLCNQDNIAKCLSTYLD